MDFTLFGTPGSSLKSTVTANLRYFVQKDARRSKGMTAPPGLITLENSCPLFTFTTGGQEEFNRKFYDPWKIYTTIYLLKWNSPNPSLLAVCLEVDPSSQVILDSHCADPGCLRYPFPTFLDPFRMPGSLWPIENTPNGLLELEDGMNLSEGPA